MRKMRQIMTSEFYAKKYDGTWFETGGSKIGKALDCKSLAIPTQEETSS